MYVRSPRKSLMFWSLFRAYIADSCWALLAFNSNTRIASACVFPSRSACLYVCQPPSIIAPASPSFIVPIRISPRLFFCKSFRAASLLPILSISCSNFPESIRCDNHSELLYKNFPCFFGAVKNSATSATK
uniref:Uncharacterized protein n=1 Tax=uncultured marine virus TaxID=186617 RepID=A0A0F7L0P2_9VIRU|nr:hypothetical protein [uncultured marine virus]